ncbi:MAG: flagellar filament capping protein FliD, partial [Candidatus Kapaibacterium sp.]
GMTINLLKAQGASDSAVSLTVAKDTDAITASLQPMVDGFNDALRYIQGNLRTAAGNDSSVRSLQSQMRSLSTKMFGGSGDSLKYLTDIGFKIEKDGALTISDKEKLKSAIQTDSTLIEKIFSGAEGLASSMQSTISGFVGTEGLAGVRSKTLGTQIAASTEKINKLKARIEKEVEQQVKDYRKLQESFYKMQGQMSQYSAFSYQ